MSGCCGSNFRYPLGEGRTSGSAEASCSSGPPGSAKSNGTCCEVILLVGLHNFFNLDLLHRGWFMLSVGLNVVNGSSDEPRKKGAGDRVLDTAECEVQLALDSQLQELHHSPESSPGKTESTQEKSRDELGGEGGGGGAGAGDCKGHRSYCSPFYIEYIEQDVPIQKTVLYRITLKQYRLLETAELELNFRLHHAATAAEAKPPFKSYSDAGSETITLSNLFNVQQYFVPLHFEKSFLSLTNVSIFASLGGLISKKEKGQERRLSHVVDRMSVDSFDTDSWSSFLSIKSSRDALGKDPDSNHFGSTITEDVLRKESPEVLRELIERLQGTLSQLFVLESVGKAKQLSGNISEFRQNLMCTPGADTSDRAQMAKEAMKILTELRKICRFAIMQHTSPAQNMIAFLFERWRYSRFRAWAKHLYFQTNHERRVSKPPPSLPRAGSGVSSRGSTGQAQQGEDQGGSDQSEGPGPGPGPGKLVARKLSKIDLIHQMSYTDEKYT